MTTFTEAQNRVNNRVNKEVGYAEALALRRLCDDGWLVALRKAPRGYAIRLCRDGDLSLSLDAHGDTLLSALSSVQTCFGHEIVPKRRRAFPVSNDPDYVNRAKRVRSELQARQMLQKTLAVAIGVTEPNLSHALHGRSGYDDILTRCETYFATECWTVPA